MAFKYKLIYPDGNTEISDDSYATEEEAEEAALYDCSCFHDGAEVLKLAGREFDDRDLDYEIFEY